MLLHAILKNVLGWRNALLMENKRQQDKEGGVFMAL